MTMQLLDSTLGSIACNVPGATRVFHEFHLDFCCGGQKSLRQAALERGINVTLDNVEALQHWPEVFRGRRLWLRVDLGRGDGHHDKVKTGGKTSKFGLPLVKLEEFLSAARALLAHTELDAKSIAVESLNIAGDICIYTNRNVVVEEL